jgi:hypothetical protein
MPAERRESRSAAESSLTGGGVLRRNCGRPGTSESERKLKRAETGSRGWNLAWLRGVRIKIRYKAKITEFGIFTEKDVQ